MTSTSRHDEDRVDELETIEEVLLSLEPDEIDYVNKLPLYLQDEAARRLALSGLSRELQGERRQFEKTLASRVQPFSCLPGDPLRKYLSCIDFVCKTRHLGGPRTLLSSGALGVNELDVTNALQESESTDTRFLSDYLSSSSSDRGSRAPLCCTLQTDLIKSYAESNASQITSLFERRGAAALLDRPLADVLWDLPEPRRTDALEAIGELKTFCFRRQALDDEREQNEGATIKLSTIIERSLIAFSALLGATIGYEPQLSHDHQILDEDRLRPNIRVVRYLNQLPRKQKGDAFLLMLIELKAKRPLDRLLAYVDDFEYKASEKGSLSYVRPFNCKSVPLSFKEETGTRNEKKIVATGSQVLMQKMHCSMDKAEGGQAHSAVVMSTSEAVVEIWLPVFSAPYSDPPPRAKTVDSAQGSFLLFSPITPFLAGGLFNVFLAPLLEETFPLFPPLYVRFFSNFVLTQPYYRTVVQAYASRGLFFWGDPRLASTATSALPSANSSSPPPLLPGGEGEDNRGTDDGKEPPAELSRPSVATTRGGVRASGASIGEEAAREWPSGGSGGETKSSQVRADSANSPPRIASHSEISPVPTCGIDVLLKLRSIPSLRRTWQGLQAKDTLVRLPPLLPSTINGLATPAASPDRSSAKRLNASTGNGGDEEFSCTDDITLEMGYDAVSYGSAGRVYRGKIGGASVLIKVSHAYDGLASEMENYRKLEMALGREGEEGLEPLTPVVGGRFCSDTGEGEMIIMEDAGMVMSHFSDWTREQKLQGLRLLERLHQVGLQHGDAAGRNFVVADDGTLRLINLENAQAHMCGEKCRELQWFRRTVVQGEE